MVAAEILDILSRSQPSLNWLANDGRQHLADARLSVFRSGEHFAVFTELPHFFYSANEFDDWLGCAGDGLVFGAYDTQYKTSRPSLLEEVAESPLWNVPAYHSDWLADRSAFSVRVKGKRYDFTPSLEDYDRAGITFPDERTGPNTINPGQFLHFLCVALDHPFFRSEAQLRALIRPEIEPRMSLFLQTTWWQHPEPLVDGSESDFESDWIENIPCWQILARAIASGDLSEWNAQDTSRFNTDWASLERIYREGNFGYGFDQGAGLPK